MAAYFPILTQQQANPTISSFQKSLANHMLRQQQQQQISDMQTQNKMNQAKLPYIAQDEQANLLAKNLQNQMEQVQAKYAPQEEQAKLAQMLAQAKYYQSGGYKGRGSVTSRDMQVMVKDVMDSNPGMSSQDAKKLVGDALAKGDMSSLPSYDRQIGLNVLSRNSPATVRAQSAKAQALAQELNNIDISPLEKYAGWKGDIDIAKAKAMMASGQGDKVPQEARDYISFQNNASKFAMDALRQGFGTSVVPDYVKSTLQKAANPGSDFWDDSKQVMNEWKKTIDWINENARNMHDLAIKGLQSQVGLYPESQQVSSPDAGNSSDPLGLR